MSLPSNYPRPHDERDRTYRPFLAVAAEKDEPVTIRATSKH